MGEKDVSALPGIGNTFASVFKENGFNMVLFILNLKIKLGESNRLENNWTLVSII